jgi:hypothetical protein
MPKSKVRDLLYALDYEHLMLGDLLESISSIDNVAYVDPAKLKALTDAHAKTKQTRETMTGDEDWEEVAVYFASCEAATAETFASVKSQKYETKRHLSICESLLAALEAGALVGKRPSDREDTIKRLRGAIESCRKKVGDGI